MAQQLDTLLPWPQKQEMTKLGKIDNYLQNTNIKAKQKAFDLAGAALAS
jgi:hypothetical protein